MDLIATLILVAGGAFLGWNLKRMQERNPELFDAFTSTFTRWFKKK